MPLKCVVGKRRRAVVSEGIGWELVSGGDSNLATGFRTVVQPTRTEAQTSSRGHERKINERDRREKSEGCAHVATKKGWGPAVSSISGGKANSRSLGEECGRLGGQHRRRVGYFLGVPRWEPQAVYCFGL